MTENILSMESPKAPSSKCDFSSLMKPNLFWIFSSVLKMSDSASQRSGFCDNTAFFVSHSPCNQQTANINQDEKISEKFFETKDRSSDNFLSNNWNKNIGANLLETNNIPMSSEVCHSDNFAVINLSVKYIYKFCKIFTTHKKHIVSNFDMNAISPTSW
ncbi:uncharacterized protein LOC111636180 [Centruroides sculpturatus]|uniref:uncharacterized protein LOC111636180 n=1 Tax=Centruroides sculpturatus TaxID=218467 RepID=UPI000C6D81D2|nr:uncharacterized protein LOC111636180 [Centruroides sculpturatus]